MTHQYTKLADELRTIAYKAPDRATSDTIFEAARILRAAAAVDVQGLMALARKFAIAEAECTVLCTSKTGKQSPEYERADKEYEVVQDALESALRLALAARQGFVMVPVEPTPEMLNAFYDAEYQDDGGDSKFSQAYRAMIAAAPKGTP